MRTKLVSRLYRALMVGAAIIVGGILFPLINNIIEGMTYGNTLWFDAVSSSVGIGALLLMPVAVSFVLFIYRRSHDRLEERTGGVVSTIVRSSLLWVAMVFVGLLLSVAW